MNTIWRQTKIKDEGAQGSWSIRAAIEAELLVDATLAGHADLLLLNTLTFHQDK